MKRKSSDDTAPLWSCLPRQILADESFRGKPLLPLPSIICHGKTFLPRQITVCRGNRYWAAEQNMPSRSIRGSAPNPSKPNSIRIKLSQNTPYNLYNTYGGSNTRFGHVY